MPAKDNVFKFRHTTKKSPSQTAGEIKALLIRLGASNISTMVEKGEIVSMAFVYDHEGQNLAFRLPIKWTPLYERELEKFESKRRSRALGAAERERSIEAMKKQAERTGWCIALEWLRVQVAFVETGARNVLEVFMADMLAPGRDSTLSEYLKEKGVMALLPPPGDQS